MLEVFARFDSSLVEYHMTSFGTTKSSFCAIFFLTRNANDWRHWYEEHIIRLVWEKFHVDHCHVSFSTLRDSRVFAVHIRASAKKADFRLHKWVSSLKGISWNAPRIWTGSFYKMSRPASEKTLVLEWNGIKGNFQLKFNAQVKPQTPRGCCRTGTRASSQMIR